MLDEELVNDIKKELPRNIPNIFISSVINRNIQELKDLLWKVLNETPAPASNS
jgi:GTP-binding protein